MVYDGMTYGLYIPPFDIGINRLIYGTQLHVQPHRLEKITDVLGYGTSESLSKLHLSCDIMVYRIPGKVCVLLEVFYKVCILGVIREEYILCTPRGELNTSSHY